MKLKNLSHYRQNKAIFNRNFNEQWKSIAGRPFIGSCSYLFLKYKPTSYQDFLDKYIEDVDEAYYNKETLHGSYYHGRSIEQINNLAKRYFEICNSSEITLEMCFDDIINHTIIETYDGHQAELLVSKKIDETNDLFTEPCEDNIDTMFGVDIVVKRKGGDKIRHFIQIKPITTFLGRYNKSLVNDRKNFYKKQEKLNEWLDRQHRSDEIKNIEFMCYDKQHYDKTKEILFLTKNGKMRFDLSELCDREGLPLLSYKTCSFEKLK